VKTPEMVFFFILGNGGGAMPQEMQDKQKAKAIKQAINSFFTQ